MYENLKIGNIVEYTLNNKNFTALLLQKLTLPTNLLYLSKNDLTSNMWQVLVNSKITWIIETTIKEIIV